MQFIFRHKLEEGGEGQVKKSKKKIVLQSELKREFVFYTFTFIFSFNLICI